MEVNIIVINNRFCKRWMKVVIACCLLALAYINPFVRQIITNWDLQVAIKMNSILAISPVFDYLLAWLSSGIGDVFMLALLYLLFLIHALRSPNEQEAIRRLAFWIWLGLICVVSYLILCTTESFIKRDTPLLTLHNFKNLQTICGISFHSCPTSSFPSGHGLAYLFFAIMAGPRYKVMSAVLWCLAIIMLSIRLAVGLHWFSDIVFGSLAIALLLKFLVEETLLGDSYKFVEAFLASLVKSSRKWMIRVLRC